jgi:hypothetical protein
MLASAYDAVQWRATALELAGLQLPVCPPARAIILLRSDDEPRRCVAQRRAGGCAH